MLAFARALLILARYVRRGAVALEELARLHRLDLDSRGLIPPTASVADPVEVSYPGDRHHPSDPFDGL